MIFFKAPEIIWNIALEEPSTNIFDKIERQLEPVPSFRMVAKLSDGGVVTRTLASPQSEKPIFGHRKANKIHFALSNIGKVSSPFQPICRCTLDSEKGVMYIKIVAKPHKQSMVLFPFYMLTCGVIIFIALFTAYHGIWTAVIVCLAMAFGLIGIPYYRMHSGFHSDLEELRQFLKRQGINGLSI